VQVLKCEPNDGLWCEVEAFKEPLIKLIPFMVRQAHHERNQPFAVRPELVEGLIQSYLNDNSLRGWVNGQNLKAK
jgi:glycerol-3-phosphate dehydrogenase (NAD(P)+)